MKAWLLVILVIVTSVTDASGSASHPNTGGCTCPSKHPQQKFCDDSLVIKGTVVDIGPDEVTARNSGMNMDMMIEVQVTEVFKSADQLDANSTVYLHTYGMCRFDMMLKVGQAYVLSATDAYQPGYFVILRECNWAQKWNTLTKKQRGGLRGDYHDCELCKITETMPPTNLFDDYSFLEPSPLGEGGRRVSFCLHNQQMALTMRHYVDCETLYSACVPKEENCGWMETKEYKKCMKKRVKGRKTGKKNKGNTRKADKGKKGKGSGGKPKSGKPKKGTGRHETTV